MPLFQTTPEGARPVPPGTMDVPGSTFRSYQMLGRSASARRMGAPSAHPNAS